MRRSWRDPRGRLAYVGRVVRTREETRGERIRAFVALQLPPALIDEVVAWQRSALAGRNSLRPVPAESLHLTLAVLGSRDPEEVRLVGEVLAELEAPPVGLRLERCATPFPRRRPSVLALAVKSPGAIVVRGELVSALVDRGLVGEEGGRTFRPHLSIARMRGRSHPGGRDPAWAWLRDEPVLSTLAAARTFGAVRVALYRSQLRSQDARYDVLAAYDLPPERGELR